MLLQYAYYREMRGTYMKFLTEEIMWNAVVHCKQEFDGMFVYAVKSTGICCKPSCRSKVPLKENVTFYSSVSKAITDGYRPCKRCQPNFTQSNEEELVQSVKQLIESEYRQVLTLGQISFKIGVSKYHLLLQRLAQHIPTVVG